MQDIKNDKPLHGCNHCHDHDKEKPKHVVLIIIEKVSAIALIAFSAYISWKLFLPWFFAGVAIGIYTHDKKLGHHNHSGSSCASGILEQLTGVKLPPLISAGANIAVTICHVEHHKSVFVPVIAIMGGNWVGRMVANLDYRKIIPCFG